MPVRVIGRIAPFTDGAFKVVEAGDLGGMFVKSVSATGLVTYQDASGDEQTAQLSGGSGGFTLRTGSAAPAASLGASGDWYLRTSNGQFYEKVSTTWHGRFTPPALSDADPEDVGTTASPGTATAAARADHVHVGGTGGSGPALSDAEPATVRGTGASAGTSADASRADHQHELADGAVTQVKLSDGSVHTSKIADGAVTAAKIPNQEIGHVKIGSSVGGQDQAAGRILEADGAGDVRWADKGGGSGGGTGRSALSSIEVPTLDASQRLRHRRPFGRCVPEPADDNHQHCRSRG